MVFLFVDEEPTRCVEYCVAVDGYSGWRTATSRSTVPHHDGVQENQPWNRK